jgi:hypothetical protein
MNGEPGEPQRVFDLEAIGYYWCEIVARPDGRFLPARMSEEERAGPRELHMVLTWRELLRAKVAKGD